MTTVVETYIGAWNERDDDARRGLVASAFADGAEYVDPMMSGRGVDEISSMIGAAQQQFPGCRFTLTTGPEEHNDRVRFSWQLAAADGQLLAGGTDFGLLAEDGRLQSVTGFLDAID
jgi:hypothetical protein